MTSILALLALLFFLQPAKTGPAYLEVVEGPEYQGSELGDFYISHMDEDITRWRSGRRNRSGGEFHWGTYVYVNATVLTDNAWVCKLNGRLETDDDEQTFSVVFSANHNVGDIISSKEPDRVRFKASAIRKDSTLHVDKLTCTDNPARQSRFLTGLALTN